MNKHKNIKAKIFISSLFICFGLFVFYLLYPSQMSVVNKDLKVATNTEDVQKVWEKYESSMGNNPDFYAKIVDKLETFDLDDNQIQNVFTWLPDRRPVNMNLVVVPDLSARIVQENNNPEQIANDKILLKKIWETFRAKYNSEINSKSSFLLTVTDDEQDRGDFYKVAHEMSVDLGVRPENIRVRDMLQDVDKNFSKNLDGIYDIAKEKTSGANYWYFVDRKLGNYFKKPTLTDKFNNKLIIITDGYLELTDGTIYTENLPGIGAKVKAGMDLDLAMKMYGKPIATTSYKGLNNWKILMLEVNERKSGVGSDYGILKKYWSDWFATMNFNLEENPDFFVHRDITTQVAENKISDFLK